MPMATETESTETTTEAKNASAETEVKSTETTQEKAETTQSKTFDPNTIAPEAKAYFEKQYEGYGKYKELSTEYENLLRSKEFQEWYQGLEQNKQEAPAKFEISDEDFVAALGDKNKFSQLVANLAERIANDKLGPQLEQTRREVIQARKTTELEQTIKQYPDFMELDNRGLVEPYLRKYPVLSFEDAYWLAKRHTMNEDIDKKARGLVEAKKNATVEKPGSSSGGRSHKVKAKTSLEAMEIAAEAYKAGRPIPEIEIESSK